MLRRHVHFRAFLPAAGLPALLTAIVLLTFAGTVVAAPETPADLDGTGDFALPTAELAGLADFAADWADPVISTSEIPWWVDRKDARFQRGRTFDWNNRFRPGRGAVSLVSEFNSYLANERDDETYFENARILEAFVTVELRGAIYPGVALFAEFGASQIQVRPDGETGFDRYEYSYRVGAGIDTLGSINEVVGFGLTVGAFTWEGRGHESNNSQVAANGGNDVTLRGYLIRGDARMILEVTGSKDGPYLNIELGASFQYQWTRLFHDDQSRNLGFRQFSPGQYNLLVGLVFGVGSEFTLHAEARLLGIIHGRLSLQLWF